MTARRRGWLALAAIPLTVVPMFVAAALLDVKHSDVAIIVTVVIGMYGILLGIPVLLSIAIDSFRRPRVPRPASRTSLVVHTLLLIAHDASVIFGGIQRCSRGDYPYWLIGYIPFLLFLNFRVFAYWHQLSLKREGALLPRRR